MKPSPDTLLAAEGRWVTQLGKWFPGVRVDFRGKNLLDDCRDWRWMKLLMWGITGREFNDTQVKLFESLWVLAISFPDPRLWNNRVAALGGTSRSTATLSAAAGVAVSEATIYGHRANIHAIDFLYRAKTETDHGADLEQVIRNELASRRRIPGYGRPIVDRDERIKPVVAMARTLELNEGPFEQLAFEIERILMTGRWRMQMNVTGLAAAMCADQGLSVREFYHYASLGFSAGILPCYIDATTKPEGAFFPLRCDSLIYNGPAPRIWESENG